MIGDYFKRVGKWNRVEYGRNLVVPITAFPKDLEAKIDLAIGENYQKRELVRLAGFASAVDFIANGDSADVIFLVEYFIKQGVQFFHRKCFQIF
jgi:hypothetical protein